MNKIWFYLVILAANIIQGITGFAGTILAMPPGLMLVGYDVAKPILNVLGLLSGIYVFLGQKKAVVWSEVKKIVIFMAVGIVIGIGIKGILSGSEQILYKILGVFVLFLSVRGTIQLHRASCGKSEEINLQKLAKKQDGTEQLQNVEAQLKNQEQKKKFRSLFLLLLAGIVHGIFVSGGPLLIGYLSDKVKEKANFRATISTVWIILNSMILFDDLRSDQWNFELLMTQVAAIPFLLAGMWIGSKLYTRMSQTFFMGLTYALLFLSGITLLVK